jgi:hypothetical protein
VIFTGYTQLPSIGGYEQPLLLFLSKRLTASAFHPSFEIVDVFLPNGFEHMVVSSKKSLMVLRAFFVWAHLPFDPIEMNSLLLIVPHEPPIHYSIIHKQLVFNTTKQCSFE